MVTMKDRTVTTKVENPKLVKKRHQQIIDGVRKLFSEKGFHQTSMRDISQASGIELSYLYKYISSKDDVLFLFHQHLAQRFEDILQSREVSDIGDPKEQLKELISRILDLMDESRRASLAMLTETRHLKKDSMKAILSREANTVKMIEGIIRRGVEIGYFRTEDPFVTANFIVHMFVFEPTRDWNLREKYTFEEYRNVIINLIMKTLEP